MAARGDGGREPTVVRPRPRGGASGKGGPAGKGRSEERKEPNGATARGGGENTWGRHRAELVALGCLGLAVFLSYVLVAGQTGGYLGEVGGGALTAMLGRLAFLLPLALLGVATRLILEFKVRWGSVWVWGVVALVVGLIVLAAAGFPPFGSGHSPETFERSLYETRAGWVGEAVYAGAHRLIGGVGVAIIGWLLMISGVSMVTGVTIKRLMLGTGRAAKAAQVGAREQTRRLRERGGVAEDRTGPLDDPYLAGFGTVRQPGAATAGGPSAAPTAATPTSEEWPSYAGPEPTEIDWVPTERDAPRPPRSDVLDGAEAFPDIYVLGQAGYPMSSPATHRAADTTTPPAAEGADHETSGGSIGAEPGLAPTNARSRQEPLPGMAGPEAQPLAEEARPHYVLPGSEILKKSPTPAAPTGRPDVEVADLLVLTLADFGVEARVVGTVIGPRVTRFELQLAPGTKVSKVSGLKDDLAYALASTEIRILAPIPGKQAVGVEVPNQRPTFVTLGDIYKDFPSTAGPLMVWLGKDIAGKPVFTDLARLPHLLIAGTTGSGKSGCVNCIISSILLRAAPDKVKLILIDPKKVELSHFEYVPHLLVPVVTNMKNAAGVLHNIVKEMENRYELMELEKARNLEDANKARARRGERPLPFVVVVIDELADLMMVSPGEVEEYIIRLAQKARAVGIHLVVATQRPSVDVITGMIKANIPSRIAFAVSSQTDSRVILDTNGAEALLGLGDMLFKPLGSNRLQRIQGAFITEEEIHRLVTHCRRQAQPEYQEELLEQPKPAVKAEDDDLDPDHDEFLVDAAEMVLETGSASVSMLQRRLRVGYTRAGRLIDMLERRGIVGPYEGSKARQILVRPGESERVLEALRGDSHDVTPPEDEPEDYL
ncbi:MAG: FtsK/SpoIIIE family DNA translocase [Thermoleophilia bacterium]